MPQDDGQTDGIIGSLDVIIGGRLATISRRQVISILSADCKDHPAGALSGPTDQQWARGGGRASDWQIPTCHLEFLRDTSGSP